MCWATTSHQLQCALANKLVGILKGGAFFPKKCFDDGGELFYVIKNSLVGV